MQQGGSQQIPAFMYARLAGGVTVSRTVHQLYVPKSTKVLISGDGLSQFARPPHNHAIIEEHRRVKFMRATSARIPKPLLP